MFTSEELKYILEIMETIGQFPCPDPAINEFHNKLEAKIKKVLTYVLAEQNANAVIDKGEQF